MGEHKDTLVKWAAFAGVILLIVVATMVLKLIYRPESGKSLKAQMESYRDQALEAELELRAAEERLNQRKNEAERRAREISEELGLDSTTTATAPTGTDGQPHTNVKVQIVRPVRFRDVLTLPAIAQAREDIRLAARNDGAVEWIGPRKGEPVRQGQEILKIDAQILLEEHRGADAAEKLARVNLDRMRSLVAQQVASPGELDRSQSEWEQAKAVAASAGKAWEDATIRATVDGVVNDILPDVGEFVNRGQTVAQVVDISTVKLLVNVPEKDIAFFREGQEALVHRPGAADALTTGRITRVSLVADDQTKTFPIEVTVDNAGQSLLPGMIVNTDLVRRNYDSAIVVPVFAVIQTAEGPVMFVEQDGQARMRRVETGARQGMEVEIARGLDPGDRLIVEGQRSLSDGARVRAVEETLP